MNKHLTILAILLISTALGLSACGSGSSDLGSPASAHIGVPQRPLAEPDARLDKFVLRVDQGSFVGEASVGQFRLERDSADGVSTLRVIGEDCRNLRALHLNLQYDASIYSPLDAAAADSIAGEKLVLPVLDRRGELEHGQVLIDPLNQPGFSGSGVLAELHFREHAFDVNDNRQPLPKIVSKAPPAPVFELLSTDEPGENLRIVMPYVMPGDYDQNSEVNVADLTPLAVHFGKKGPFELGSVETVVDGDSNGEINIADISVIGANFKNGFVAAEAFSGSQQDYDDGTGSVLASWNFNDDAEGSSSQQRLWFAVDFNGIADDSLCWTTLNPIEASTAAAVLLSAPTAPVNEGQRVMSLDAQAVPLQLEAGETVDLYASIMDADAAIGRLVVDFGDGTVEQQDLSPSVQFSLQRISHVYAAAGEYDLTASFSAAADSATGRAAGLLPRVRSRSFHIKVLNVGEHTAEAIIGITPTGSANSGTPVSLTGELSTPAGGSSIINYKWDFNGDGLIDEETVASGTEFTPADTDVGLGLAGLVVSADDGGEGAATRAYIYSRSGDPAISCSLAYDGPANVSGTTLDTTVQIHPAGLGDMLPLIEFRIVDFPPDSAAPVFFPGEADTDINVSLNGAGPHLLRAEMRFAGSLLYSDETTITLGARGIELTVEPDNTTIKAPITFIATAENPELIDHFLYEFGDGNQLNSTEPSVVHEYTVKQNYDATVTAFWTDDKQNTSAPVHVICGFERLVEIEVDTALPFIEQELNFTANVDFPELITEYTYDFGDGNTLTTTDTSVPYTYTLVGTYNARLIAVYSDGPTTVSDNLQLIVGDAGQLVTEPLLEIISEENDFPKLVRFSAANTLFKAGTTLLSFGIDFGDGDSVTNITNISQDVYHAYYTAGDFTAVLSVRDTDFELNTDNVSVSVVNPGGKYQYATIAGTPNTFEVVATKPVRGAPQQFVWSAKAAGGSDGFATKNGVNDLYHLYFARPANPAGTSWEAPAKIVEAKGNEGHFSAAAAAAGPAVAFYTYNAIVDTFPDDGDLSYVQATDNTGAAWGTPVLVSETGDIGRYPALEIVNGNPAIVSRLSTSLTEGTGKYIRATAADGSTWGSLLDIGPAVPSEAFFSMMNVNAGGNKPAVAMQVGNGGQIRLGYQVADDGNGDGWTPGNTFTFTSNDRAYGVDMQHWVSVPWIAYQDSIAGRVYFQAANDAAGSSWPDPTESFAIDAPEGRTPGSFSLGAAGTTPAILVSIKGGTAGVPEPVYVVTASNDNGTDWNAPEIVGWTLEFHSVAFGEAQDGKQLIVFYDNLNKLANQGRLRSGSR